MKSLPRLILLAAFAPAAYSQSVLYNFYGDWHDELFGFSVSGAGDVNGDGYDDLIVGGPEDGHNGPRSGNAVVFSGVDGSILRVFYCYSKYDRFGYSVSGAGDVNGDGFADLIVGAYLDNNNGDYSGSADVFSGLDGSIIYTFTGDSSQDHFGYSVSGAGDVNGDGYSDLIVGAPADDPNGKGSGSARVFSGFDGSVLYTFDGDGAVILFGHSVSTAGDVNGDGFDDLIVGFPYTGTSGVNPGGARVFSGVDGSVLYTFDGDSAGDYFGQSVSGAGDVNGDGYDDLIVGAPWDDDINNGTQAGSARIFSGLDGSILYTMIGDSMHDRFGISVSGAGDVNGDGFDDLIVGAYLDDNNGDSSGSTNVYSGADGTVLYTFDGSSRSAYFGRSVSGAGDVNRDGLDDLIVGAYYDLNNSGTRTGSARVFSGCDSCDLSIGQIYCDPAIPNSTGQSAAISAFGSTTASNNFVTLTANQLPLNIFGYFLNSDVQGFTAFPGGSSGNLCLGGAIGRHRKQVANSGVLGELGLDVDLTALPRPNGTHSVVAGETWNFQCWFRDKVAGQSTSNFTDGIEIVFN